MKHIGLFVIVLLILVGFSSCGDTSHTQKGQDWLDIGNTSNAREEFMMAIKDSPKSVAPRYHIAYSYYIDGNYLEAISWLRETLSISQKHKKTINLLNKIHEDVKSLLSSQNVNQQALGLKIIENFLSEEDIDCLIKVLGSTNNNNAFKAEKLLSRIATQNPKYMKGFISLLNMSNKKVRERVAERLWLIERNPDAANILRNKYINIFINSGNDKNSTNTAGDWLVKLGFDSSLQDVVAEKLGIHKQTLLVGKNLGDKITQKEFSEITLRWSRLFFPEPIAPKIIAQKIWKEVAIFSQAEKMGIFISKEELTLEIQSFVPVDLSTITENEDYSSFIEKVFHLTEQQFEKTIKEYLLGRKLRYFLKMSVNITDDEAYQRYVKENADLDKYEREKDSIISQYLIEKQLSFISKWESWAQRRLQCEKVE